jgi:hypothetical protein
MVSRLIACILVLLMLPASVSATVPAFRSVYLGSDGDRYIVPWATSDGDTAYVFSWFGGELWRASAPLADGTGGNGMTFNKRLTHLHGSYTTQTPRGLLAGEHHLFIGLPTRNLLRYGNLQTATTDGATLDTLVYANDAARTPVMWRGCVDDSGYVYVGEYTLSMAGGAAHIWRSGDDGATWPVHRNWKTDTHVHSIGWDSTTGSIYAAIGDSASGKATHARITRSDNRGLKWSRVSYITMPSQPVDMAFCGTRRMFGSDAGKQGIYGFQGALEDTAASGNGNFTWWLNLGFGTDGLGHRGAVWSFGQDTAHSFIFAGTTRTQTATPNDTMAIWASWNGGRTWKRAETLGVMAEPYAGIDWISEPTLQHNPYWYVTKVTYEGTEFYRATYRYQRKRTWTVGAGGDYATVALALADTLNVGAGDTLSFLTGTHTVTGTQPFTNMVWQSATGNRADATLNSTTEDASAILLSKNFTLRNVTLTATTPFNDLGVAFIAIGTAASAISITVDNVLFSGVTNSAGTACVTWDASSVDDCTFTMTNCVMSECAGKTGTTSAVYGLVNVADVDATINNCVFSKTSGNSGGMAAVYINITDRGYGRVTNCLFSNIDASRSSSGVGAALRILNTPDGPDSSWVRHCTFYDCDAATAAAGAIRLGGAKPAWLGASHNIITDSNTPAVSRAGVTIGVWRYNDVWNCTGDIGVKASSATDTLRVDPLFRTMEGARGGFMPTNRVPDAQGSSVCVTDETPASYMGYIEPQFPVPGRKRHR